MRRTEYVDAVLEVVERVPPGMVLTYGDVAEMVDLGSARTVGMVLAHWGDEVPWWRIVNASGRPPPHHVDEALTHLRAEGTPLRGPIVDLPSARWPGR